MGHKQFSTISQSQVFYRSTQNMGYSVLTYKMGSKLEIVEWNNKYASYESFCGIGYERIMVEIQIIRHLLRVLFNQNNSLLPFDLTY